MGGFQGFHAALDRIELGRIDRPQVRAARRPAVICRRGRRGPAPEVFLIVERLADQPTADDFAVARDQAAFRG